MCVDALHIIGIRCKLLVEVIINRIPPLTWDVLNTNKNKQGVSVSMVSVSMQTNDSSDCCFLHFYRKSDLSLLIELPTFLSVKSVNLFKIPPKSLERYTLCPSMISELSNKTETTPKKYIFLFDTMHVLITPAKQDHSGLDAFYSYKKKEHDNSSREIFNRLIFVYKNLELRPPNSRFFSSIFFRWNFVCNF